MNKKFFVTEGEFAGFGGRLEVVEHIEKNGGEVVEELTADVDYMVYGMPDEDYDLPTMSAKELFQALNAAKGVGTLAICADVLDLFSAQFKGELI